MAWTLPGYSLDELLASGARAEVWRGRDLRSGRPVAIKRLRPGSLSAVQVRAEVAAAGALPADHVLRVIDVIVDGEAAVIVSELAAGGSLAQLLSTRGHLFAPEVVATIGPLGTVLAEAHARLIVHGDVSPGNVLYDADARALLADFGLARLAGDPATAVAATLGYLDPAVARGGTPDAASDVFGLAAVAYASLTGRPPWLGLDDAQVIAAAALGRRPALLRLAPVTPPALAGAVEGGLDVDPSRRPSAAELAAAVLASCAPARVTLSRPPSGSIEDSATAPLRGSQPTPSQTPPAHRQQRRRSRVRVGLGVAAAVALTLCLAIGAGVAWGRVGQPVERLPDAVVAPSSPFPARPAASRPPTPVTLNSLWLQRIRRFTRLRDQVIAHRSDRLLGRVYLATCPQLATDRSTIRRLRQGDLAARGLRQSIQRVDVRHQTTTEAKIRLTVSTSAWQVRDLRTRRVVEIGNARPDEPMAMTLRRTFRGWRIEALAARGGS